VVFTNVQNLTAHQTPGLNLIHSQNSPSINSPQGRKLQLALRFLTQIQGITGKNAENIFREIRVDIRVYFLNSPWTASPQPAIKIVGRNLGLFIAWSLDA
jgi:hypothetical protein